MLISFICSLILIFLLGFIFYGIINRQYKDIVRSKAYDIAFILDNDYDNIEFLENNKHKERITLIGEDGTVLFDNYADVSELENHKDRPEVLIANSYDFGETERYSETLDKKTFYCAVRLESGEVLRVSITTRSIFDVFLDNIVLIISTIILIAFIINILAWRVTKNIIKPIINIDFDNYDLTGYNELEPFLYKIKEQKRELVDKLENIKYQNNAILTITENMQEGIILLDEHNDILTYNDSICDIFSIDKDFIGKNIYSFFRDNDFITILKHLEEKSSYFIFENNKFFYQVSVSPVYREKEIKGSVILFVDITEKERTEKFKKEFTANVSHELKTPLMSILGYSELIESGLVQDEDVSRFISKIRKESVKMTSLVEDILLISNLDESASNDYKDKTFEAVNMKELILEVVESLSGLAKKKNVEIVLNCEELYYKVDKKLFYQLVKNLVYNGIVYNKEDGKVFIELEIIDKKLHLWVKDTGIGIERIHQSRVFERFYRVDESRDRRKGGTGLGLALVKNIALYHNGEVKLTSEVSKGSTFEVIVSY